LKRGITELHQTEKDFTSKEITAQQSDHFIALHLQLTAKQYLQAASFGGHTSK
jgi:hypothetical protein